MVLAVSKGVGKTGSNLMNGCCKSRQDKDGYVAALKKDMQATSSRFDGRGKKINAENSTLFFYSGRSDRAWEVTKRLEHRTLGDNFSKTALVLHTCSCAYGPVASIAHTRSRYAGQIDEWEPS